MSRIGKLPIKIPQGVSIDVKGQLVTIKGKLGELQQEIAPSISVKQEDDNIVIERASEAKQDKAFHGLYRSLINNMVIGVSEGFELKQELVGVGFRAEAKGQILELNLGYSHPIFLELPPEIKVETVTERRSNSFITLKSVDKQLLGMIAAKIRSFRPPEPYKQKGIRFAGEELRKKAGKSASAK